MYTVRQTEVFRNWLDRLADVRAQVRIAARVRRIEAGSLGDWRSVGDGVSELRVDAGPGYRLYFTRREKVVIVLLCGGGKGSQKRDIARAKRLARELEDER